MLMDRLIPPLDLINWTGSGDAQQFVATGKEFFGYFREYADLKPTAKVLDLGCGCGRLALPLIDYLSDQGSYDGVDVDPKSIAWATQNITPVHPNFRFHHADVFNLTYNAAGKIPPYRYRLPFENETFDFVFLASVFTHMLPPGMENYLAEISRVLKVGGRCLMTYFLQNDDTAKLIRSGKSIYRFKHRWGNCVVDKIDSPENVVGYDLDAVYRYLHATGFVLDRPILFGNWSGRTTGVSFQDMIVARKDHNISALNRMVRTLRLYRFQQPRFAAAA